LLLLTVFLVHYTLKTKKKIKTIQKFHIYNLSQKKSQYLTDNYTITKNPIFRTLISQNENQNTNLENPTDIVHSSISTQQQAASTECNYKGSTNNNVAITRTTNSKMPSEQTPTLSKLG
jgi:hypothetical protein